MDSQEQELVFLVENNFSNFAKNVKIICILVFNKKYME